MTAPAAPARAEYAGLISRSIAYVLDTVVATSLVSGAVALIVVAGAVTGAFTRNLALAAASAYLFFLPAVMAFYCGLFWLLAGRTPGMAVVGLRVMRTDGRPVRWFAALVRGVVLACFPIGALWLLVDRRRQALHDKIARTVVVRPAPAQQPAPAIRQG